MRDGEIKPTKDTIQELSDAAAPKRFSRFSNKSASHMPFCKQFSAKQALTTAQVLQLLKCFVSGVSYLSTKGSGLILTWTQNVRPLDHSAISWDRTSAKRKSKNFTKFFLPFDLCKRRKLPKPLRSAFSLHSGSTVPAKAVLWQSRASPWMTKHVSKIASQKVLVGLSHQLVKTECGLTIRIS